MNIDLSFKDNLDVKVLDKLLWLSSPAFKKNQHTYDVLYPEAVAIGKETAEKHPFEPDKIMVTLKNFNNDDRAYYSPDEKKVFLNKLFIAEMTDYFKSQSLFYFSEDMITSTLIHHEYFHHIEEYVTVPTDLLLQNTKKTFVPPIYRDIAAFSFTNTSIPNMVCQLIDLFWLKKKYPKKYNEIISNYSIIVTNQKIL